ncbi:MAG: glycosyltransferase [Solirubrobacteraceae bacterium]
MSVLIVDSVEGFLDPKDEPFEVICPQELHIADFETMAVRYSATELCCALKPSILSHLLSKEEIVVYLDSDMRIYAPFDGLTEALEKNSTLLTPHLLDPLPEDGLQPDELAILLAGSFNLGFVAARATPATNELLDWWAQRLRTKGYLDPAHGMVFDQRWADLMPGLFNHVGMLRDPGWNFGYWRASNSVLRDVGGQILVEDTPLRCFHFTGFDVSHPERLSNYENRALLDRDAVLRELCKQFSEQLYTCGHSETRDWPYTYEMMASGTHLTPELRQLWVRASSEGAVIETPFTSAGESAFLEWLASPEPGNRHKPLNRYLTALHKSRSDLQTSFPDPDRENYDDYLEWAAREAEYHPQGMLALLQESTQRPARPGLYDLSPGESIGAKRDEVVVCIPVYGALELFAEAFTSVLAHTPHYIRILIADDASPDPAIGSFLTSLEHTLEHEVLYLRQPENLGFPGNVNAAFLVANPADVIVLNSDCVVADGWLEGMRHAAYSDSLVATATALTNHGTILSVPERNYPQSSLPQDQDLLHLASAVRAQSLRLYPTLPTAIGHCIYVRRQALDLVGDFDLAFSPGYGEEVDFSQRCILSGLIHVAADDVFVLHHANGTFAEDGKKHPAQQRHEAIIDSRYPYYQRAQTAFGNEQFGPLPRALSAARRAIKGITVTIDARCLGPIITGTQVHTLELIRALNRTSEVYVRVITPPQVGQDAMEQLNTMDHVELVPHHAVHAAMAKTDVAHRPYQVSSSNDLLVLRCAGERQVITHQDLIAYRNPGYFPGYPQWQRYQRLTRQALAAADGVVFFSKHAAEDSLREDLVDPSRSHVAYIGVDHSYSGIPLSADPPRGIEGLGDSPMLLCLGTDFRHKNRVFALRLLEALRANHEWNGTVVFAGPRVSHGSSAGEEAAFLATRPDLARSVITLPAVSESEKVWLLERSTAVLYPTTFEGFGLMPFEAAAHDRPCLFASNTALAETLPAELATIVPWDPIESARRINSLLGSPSAMARQISGIRREGSRFTWSSTADQLMNIYRVAARSPARDASLLTIKLDEIETERDEAERKYNELWEGITPEIRMLIGIDSPLTPETRQSFTTLVRHSRLHRVVLGPVKLAARVRHSLGKGEAPEEPLTSIDTLALHFAPPNTNHMLEQLEHANTNVEELASEPERIR